MKTDNIEPYVIAAVSRSLQALVLLSQNQSLGVTELAEQLGVHKNNAFRILATFQSEGFVEQDLETEKYRLTTKIGTLVSNTAIQNSTRIASLAEQIVGLVQVTSPTDRVEVVVESPLTATEGDSLDVTSTL